MVVQFEKTITEADFQRPLLDPTEERAVREARGDVDLDVEGLESSLLGKLFALVSGHR